MIFFKCQYLNKKKVSITFECWCALTLQLLSSSAVKMMDPHFFPGIPLRAKKKRKEKEESMIRRKIEAQH